MGRKLSLLRTFPPTWLCVLMTFTALAIFLGLTVILGRYEAQLTAATAYGVIDLEFAFTAARAETILDAWGPDLIALELTVTRIDFYYIAAYTAVLHGLCVLLGRNELGRRQRVAFFAAILPFAAALFDIIENIFLIQILKNSGAVPGYAPVVASLAASVKFALLAIVVAVLLYFLLRRLDGRLRR